MLTAGRPCLEPPAAEGLQAAYRECPELSPLCAPTTRVLNGLCCVHRPSVSLTVSVVRTDHLCPELCLLCAPTTCVLNCPLVCALTTRVLNCPRCVH
ncbi:unnamed protein product [Staurois parvus]|uniref:Uncharacterized protein n=1 Tax=Staurois parvus TaxID=386267 RepID=A0ABN9BZ57_9NEOB|nr:unnamed protein product [Staurois parvus]